MDAFLEPAERLAAFSPLNADNCLKYLDLSVIAQKLSLGHFCPSSGRVVRLC